MPASRISPLELLKEFLEAQLEATDAPGGVVIAKATDAQMDLGVVVLAQTGLSRTERLAPLVWPRFQIRCVARALADADTMAQSVYDVLHRQQDHRFLIAQESTGLSYLVHQALVTAGPSTHWDNPEAFATLLFCEMTIGLEPVAV